MAHTNVPGSRNAKRYQDIEDLLAVGIHVITTINVQHLESLYDTIEKSIQVKVRERIPDSVLAEADQIVNVDLATEDLQQRLREGKVYPQSRIETALGNFFITDNLEQLRELTLRELASQIDYRRREPLEDEAAVVPDQIMVCLSSTGPTARCCCGMPPAWPESSTATGMPSTYRRPAKNPRSSMPVYSGCLRVR